MVYDFKEVIIKVITYWIRIWI